jgi:hypothetical protein
MALIDRVKNILLTPKTEWPKNAGEAATVQSLYADYILILAAIGPLAMALRSATLGLTVAIMSYVINVLTVYLLAWIVDALAPHFGGEKNMIESLKLVAYSSTASWLAGIFHLVNLGSVVMLIATIYTVYTFYLGLPVMKKCPQDKTVVYTIVTVLCAILVGGVLGSLLSSAMFGHSVVDTIGPGLLR